MLRFHLAPTSDDRVQLWGMRIREPWPLARTRQRRREFSVVFDRVPRTSLGDGLEIGAGDGFLASMVAPHCRSFVTTDSYRARLAAASPCPAAAPRRLICDATALPFARAAFDFIFSSSVLEHVRDRPAAFAEMDRCLRPGGLMLHIMPSRTWKALQLAFYYPHLALGAVDLGLERLTRSRQLPASPCAAIGERWNDGKNWRFCLRTILHGAIPRVHGEFAGHWSEWVGFAASTWVNEFRAAGFDVHQVLPLPLYSGYGFGFERLRILGERLRLSSHNAFVLSRRGDPVPERLLSAFTPRPPARALTSA